MKRIINGIPMWVSQRPSGKSQYKYWYGTSIDPVTGKQRSHYIGKTLPTEDTAIMPPLNPWPNDGLFRCYRCGGHPCKDEFFVLCEDCYQKIRPWG